MGRRSKINVIKHFCQQTIEIGKPLSQKLKKKRVGKTRSSFKLTFIVARDLPYPSDNRQKNVC